LARHLGLLHAGVLGLPAVRRAPSVGSTCRLPRRPARPHGRGRASAAHAAWSAGGPDRPGRPKTSRSKEHMVTPTPTELEAVRLCMARTTLHALVREMLTGSGLQIRDRDKKLVINNPRDPDRAASTSTTSPVKCPGNGRSGTTAAISRATPSPPKPTPTPSRSPTPERSFVPWEGAAQTTRTPHNPRPSSRHLLRRAAVSLCLNSGVPRLGLDVAEQRCIRRDQDLVQFRRKSASWLRSVLSSLRGLPGS
jgi:hypothetical protein